MKISNPQKIWLVSLSVLTAMALITYAQISSHRRLQDSERWVAHTEQVIATSDAVLSQTRDIESATRGYVITGDATLLHTLPALESVTLLDIAGLKQLTTDNAAQRMRVESLGVYMQERIAVSRQMIDARRTQGLAAAVSLTTAQLGRQYTDRILTLTDAIQQEEYTLLALRKKINERSRQVQQWFAWGLGSALFLFVILLLISISTYWKNKRLKLSLEKQNNHLENTVSARTAGMEKYKYFFYNTLDLACFMSITGYLEEVNQKFAAALGYSSADLIGRHIFDFIHADDIAATETVVEMLAQGRDAVHFINRFKTHDGVYIHLEWNAVYNADTQKVHAIAKNVTDRLAAMTELTYQSKEKANRAAELLLANEELVHQNEEKGKRAAELIIANRKLAFQNREREKRAAELLIANAELAYQNEEKGKRADELVVANEELLFQSDEKGKRASELIEANKELAFQNKEKGRRAAELLIANEELAYQNIEKGKRADELAIANTELAFQNAEKGKRADELAIANDELAYQNIEKGKLADELLIAYKELAYQNAEKGKRADELLIANKELLYQSKEKGKRADELAIANQELAFQNKEKEKRANELMIANQELIYQSEEKSKRAYELLVANTELKKAEDAILKLNESLEEKVAVRTAELLAANKELEAFSYSVSHDLRSPMVSISGFAQIINSEYAKDFCPELQELFSYIESSSVRMTTIIDDLLTLAKNDKEKLLIADVNLNVLFQDVWDNLLFTNPHPAILEIEHMPVLKGDPSMLRQVVVNLLSNAIKYSSKGERPMIEVGYETYDERMVIYVRDNGAGFDMKFYNRLFGAFQRLHGISEYAGTGVGLTLVKRIIERHGGEVWAEGQVDKGATFYFSLPLPVAIRKMRLAGKKSLAA